MAKHNKHQSAVVKAKREKAKKNIVIKVAPLFLKNGFDKTTIKDIEEVTGLKAGSIYNLFEDKADILRACSVMVYESIVRESNSHSERGLGRVETIAFPIILELHASANSEVIATLLDDSRHSNNVKKELMSMRMNFVTQCSNDLKDVMNDDEIRVSLIGLSGAQSGFISNYRTNPHNDCRAESIAMVKILISLFKISFCPSPEQVVDNVLNYIKSRGNSIEDILLKIESDEPSQ